MFIVGELVTGIDGTEFEGFYGIVLGLDEDEDPIIKWAGIEGSWERAQCGEYKSQIQRAR
tara:strand:- start:884 stop:1063 length:180 start_codon:yes stop_codon:yes gene_type:complete